MLNNANVKMCVHNNVKSICPCPLTNGQAAETSPLGEASYSWDLLAINEQRKLARHLESVDLFPQLSERPAALQYLMSLENSFSKPRLLLSFQSMSPMKTSRMKMRSREPTMLPTITAALFGAVNTRNQHSGKNPVLCYFNCVVQWYLSREIMSSHKS